MQNATACWSGEELKVTFSGTMEKTDFGVPGSPEWDDIRDIQITAVTLLGVEFDPKTLSKSLQDRLMSLADDIEWLN